jgi:Group II intron, maturase-specific domain
METPDQAQQRSGEGSAEEAQWKKARDTNVQTVLNKLNPIIRGWANYFRTVVTKEIFSTLDHWMYGAEIPESVPLLSRGSSRGF